MRKKRDIVAMTEEEIVLRKEQNTIEDLYGTFLSHLYHLYLDEFLENTLGQNLRRSLNHISA